MHIVKFLVINYYLWLANLKLKEPGSLGKILLLGAHLNIIVGDPFKLVGKDLIEGVRAPWINIIVGGLFKLVDKNCIKGVGAP